MNASSKHVYDSDKKVKGRKNKFYFKNKFEQVDTGKEESVSSSYLSLSGHDSGVTWQSSISYASVGGAETLSDLSSGYLSVDENPGSPDSECDDSKYDDSCNSWNNCFSCFLDGIETLATHMCQTCRPEKNFICHKCLQQHNKFCEEHDVISLSVIYEQRTEPNSNSLEQTYNSYDRYDQAVILKAKNIHKPVTDLPNQKDKMQESGKKTFYEIVPMDHRKYSEHQLTISPEQSAEPSTDSTDELKRSSTHMVAKPMGLSVPLRHVDKASQTYFSDELKHSSEEMGEKHGTSELFPADSVHPPTSDKAWADYHQTMLPDILDELKKNELPMDEKPGVLSLFSTDNDSHKNKDGEGDIAFQEKAPSTVRNKNEINQCHLQKDRPVDRRKVKASFTERNKNKRNQCHVQSVPELEKEIPHTGKEKFKTLTTGSRVELLVWFHNFKGDQRAEILKWLTSSSANEFQVSKEEDSPELQNNNIVNTSEHTSTIPAPAPAQASNETSLPGVCDITLESRFLILKYVIHVSSNETSLQSICDITSEPLFRIPKYVIVGCLLYITNCLIMIYLQYLSVTLLQQAWKIINLALHSTSHTNIKGTQTEKTKSVDCSVQTSERSDLKNAVCLQHTEATRNKRLDRDAMPGIEPDQDNLSSTHPATSSLPSMSDIDLYGNDSKQEICIQQYEDAVPGRKKLHISMAMTKNSFHRSIPLRQDDCAPEIEVDVDKNNLLCALPDRTVHHNPNSLNADVVVGRKTYYGSNRRSFMFDWKFQCQIEGVDGKRSDVSPISKLLFGRLHDMRHRESLYMALFDKTIASQESGLKSISSDI